VGLVGVTLSSSPRRVTLRQAERCHELLPFVGGTELCVHWYLQPTPLIPANPNPPIAGRNAVLYAAIHDPTAAPR
jgi:hypothetical protein